MRIILQQILQGFYMPFVLKDRIVKSIFGLIYHLSPVLAGFITKNPAAVILRLYDKYAVYRYNNVVNLSRFTAAGRNQHIIDNPVLFFVQKLKQYPDSKLTEIPFYGRQLQYKRNYRQNNDCIQHNDPSLQFLSNMHLTYNYFNKPCCFFRLSNLNLINTYNTYRHRCFTIPSTHQTARISSPTQNLSSILSNQQWFV